jgi:hypothetical protein
LLSKGGRRREGLGRRGDEVGLIRRVLLIFGDRFEGVEMTITDCIVNLWFRRHVGRLCIIIVKSALQQLQSPSSKVTHSRSIM